LRNFPSSGLPLIPGLAGSCATAGEASRTEGTDAGKDGFAADGGTGGTKDGAGNACTPGKQEACPCLGGAQGVQACTSDGSGFSPCVGRGALTAQSPDRANSAVIAP
jgi:hypothetical protein